MRIGGLLILTCPHCGETEGVTTLLSGNTFGATYWSDFRTMAPMLPSMSPIQKCPYCGKYYLWYKQQGEYRHNYEMGDERHHMQGCGVGYEDEKEALRQLLAEDLEEDDEKRVRKDFINTFNDHFYRESWLPNHTDSTPTEKDLLLFKENALSYIALLDAKEDTTLIAELYREIGDFAKCEKILSEAEETTSSDMELRSMILEHCKASDSKVFCLNPEGDTF